MCVSGTVARKTFSISDSISDDYSDSPSCEEELINSRTDCAGDVFYYRHNYWALGYYQCKISYLKENDMMENADDSWLVWVSTRMVLDSSGFLGLWWEGGGCDHVGITYKGKLTRPIHRLNLFNGIVHKLLLNSLTLMEGILYTVCIVIN